jgi:hypothetical protein
VISCGIPSFLVVAMLGAATPDVETRARPVQVEFDAPAGCPGPQAFYESLRSRTARVRKATGDETRTTLQIKVTRQRGRVLGELRLVDDGGSVEGRKVQGVSCEDVIQALSLTAALAMDPAALLTVPSNGVAGTAPASSSEVAPGDVSESSSEAPTAVSSGGTTPSAPVRTLDKPAVPESPPAQAPPARPTPPPPPRIPAPTEEASASNAPITPDEPVPVPSFELSVGPVGLALLSGSYSPGIALAVRKVASGEGSFRPSVGLAVGYARNDVWQSAGVAQVALAWGEGSLCPWRWSASILTLQPCVDLLAGWLSATGRQVVHPSTTNRLWLSAGGALRLSAWLGHGFSAEVQAGLEGVLLRRRLYTTLPNHVVAQTPALSPKAGVGLAYGW